MLVVGKLAGCGSAMLDGSKRGRQGEGRGPPNRTRWTFCGQNGSLGLTTCWNRVGGVIVARRRGCSRALKPLVAFMRIEVAVYTHIYNQQRIHGSGTAHIEEVDGYVCTDKASYSRPTVRHRQKQASVMYVVRMEYGTMGNMQL